MDVVSSEHKFAKQRCSAPREDPAAAPPLQYPNPQRRLDLVWGIKLFNYLWSIPFPRGFGELFLRLLQHRFQILEASLLVLSFHVLGYPQSTELLNFL
jgi:hypothetical protein